MASSTPHAHAPSYYAATAVGLVDHPRLSGEAEADVCVVGGGFTGLSTALHLAERGYRVVLLEAERLGWGASGRNGGQLGTGLRKAPWELEELVGSEAARALWKMSEEAKALVKDRIRRHGIACDLKPGVLHVAHKPALTGRLQDFAERLARDWDYPHVEILDRAGIAERLGTSVYDGGWLDRDAGHLHPLNYALGLARAAAEAGARLHEQSAVERLEHGDGVRAVTAAGSVKARYLVLACNAYLGRLEPRIARRIMPVNNYVIATEPLGEAHARALIRDDVAVADSKYVIDYYRLSADKRLLWGGGETYRRAFPRDIAAFVRPYMQRVFPELRSIGIDYAWGGTLAVTVSRLPSFGRLEGDIYYAHGYSGQGVALTSLAGKLIAEAIAGTAERFDLFARLPVPSFPGGTLLRWPGMVLGMFYYSLKDRL